ncbi:RsmB/NOP family class I SAM-dependent RNA methyltransferase [Microbacterium terricola]|uniref:Methyltransferase n=1 Tax=Microbacterium terricola TaxID=344163 RepID=A0ABM8DY12_9MICO|nr:transcription antitermination factor NusB [Microbacterium terricola]UYK38742.1 rRNA small subunit methyltransferase B [Microbacterium terricola]BDV30568.1 methyltransferase [Microbacterium terricola]
MSGASPARQVAFDTIRAVHESDAYANLLLPRALARAGLSTADAALTTELTYGTLRRQGTYDAVIGLAADRSIHDIDPPVLDALRLGVHQLLSTRVASHAAVNESVELARSAGGRGAAGFANAVLRRVARDTPGDWITHIEQSARSDDERLGLTTSHPVWVVRAFRRALAAEGRADELHALLAADNASPRVTMAALPGIAEVPDGARRTPFSPVGFRLEGGDPEGLITSSGGTLRVQDEGSQLAALALTRAVPVRAGERWLDLCAGPGGKTAVLAAEALAHGAILEANEVSPARAGLVRQAIAGVPLRVEVSEQDGRVRAAASPDAYDRILVDAPCTGLGALRRRPEARWRKAPTDVPELTALQGDLLRAAFTGLRPGGIVAYVTCSPHLAETASVVADLRREVGDQIEELDARAVIRSVSHSEPDLPEPADGSGRAQLWPHRHNTDAMSITLLRKRA